jgi:hypothetical protein
MTTLKGTAMLHASIQVFRMKNGKKREAKEINSWKIA